MSFEQSCLDIRIEVRGDHTVLLAGAGLGDDEYEPAELILDEHIGNSDGFFTWEGDSFTESAENIDLSFREDGVWLEGDLPEVGDGERGRQGINLSEHIENQNGQLVFVGF
ncbi:CVNH domain-containing protein [Aspergillus ruber CBS 135680]|uniref:Cyanovirin-N n=1 Tax=Aspergillus ruber (strain CBS 135680) TaxID=1388766 RepID=A0A017SFR3_ASPRC|nr:Cyanovirin-N [Aspergillus ruber CBS 135680]EYE95479.1 Cyanovirin-N [Aspergillus ruber CBS 135680]